LKVFSNFIISTCAALSGADGSMALLLPQIWWNTESRM